MKTTIPGPKASRKSSKSKRPRYGPTTRAEHAANVAARAAKINTDRSKAKARRRKLKIKARKLADNPPPALKAKLVAMAKAAAVHAFRRWLRRPDVAKLAAEQGFVGSIQRALAELVPEHLVEN